MRLNTPSTVAAASDTSLCVVGNCGALSGSLISSSGGRSGTSINSILRPPVSRLADARRARRPPATRRCRNARALSAVTSPGRPNRAGCTERLTFRRTRLSPYSSKLTTPAKASTSPIFKPAISTGAPTARPEMLSSNTTLSLSGSTSDALKREFRADSLSGKISKTNPSCTGSPPDTKVSKVTPPPTSVASEEKSISAPDGPMFTLNPDASQNRVLSLISERCSSKISASTMAKLPIGAILARPTRPTSMPLYRIGALSVSCPSATVRNAISRPLCPGRIKGGSEAP